mgnify:CR=1 FL=1
MAEVVDEHPGGAATLLMTRGNQDGLQGHKEGPKHKEDEDPAL